MSLFDPERTAAVAPEDAVAVAHDYTRKLRAWAVGREIPKLQARLAEAPSAEDAAKLHQWTTFRDFCDHALGELESGALDHWFSDNHSRPEVP